MLLILLAMQAEQPIYLACSGEGDRLRTQSSTGQVYSGGEFGTVTTQHRVSEDFRAEVSIELNGETGRIRPPSALRPPLNYGGTEGWWPLRDIRYSQNEITARFTLNLLNHPRVRLDRVTGSVTIDARGGSFMGRCEPYDPNRVQRRF